MFSAVFGMFSQDFAVDLGSSRTRVYLKGAGVVRDEPTVVAIHTPAEGVRSAMAFGEEAAAMLGRTPFDIEAVQPVRAGQVADYEVVEALLLNLVRQLHGRNAFLRPRVAVSVPFDASDMAHRAVRDCCEFAGAREVSLVPRPLAAALGSGLPVEEPAGCMVVDIGGDSAEVAVLSLSEVVRAQRVTGGGGALDAAIRDHLRIHHALEIGLPTAERVKRGLGGLPLSGGSLRISGRCLHSGLPRAVEAPCDPIRHALLPPIAVIGQTIRTVLDEVADELASDILDQGVVLTGGAARLSGLDFALRQGTGLPIIIADCPETAVIRGLGTLLEESNRLRAVAC